MATMPPRVEALKDSIPSILPQCSRLFVYMNNFNGVIPEILKHPKITIYESEKEIGDLGDVGKFYNCEEWEPGYHFTADDKIIYPENYSEYMIATIEKYNREAVVSLHGRLFHNRPSRSYYFDVARFYGCLQNHPENFVHEIGTGVLAFHTDTLRPQLEWFPRINMTDIYFSIECQKRKVPLLVAAHSVGFVRISTRHDDNYSIHAHCNKNDKVQTDLINGFTWHLRKL